MKDFLYYLKQHIIPTSNLAIPKNIDKKEVLGIVDDGWVLKQWQNDSNYCLLIAYPNEERPIETMIYFSRFFTIGGVKTVVSHDAQGSDLISSILNFGEKLNYFIDN